MPFGEQSRRKWLTIFAFLASVGGLASIAVSHICLGIASLLLLLKPKSVRFPPIAWPILAFMLWTLVSTAASADPAAAWPQIKKFFVFAGVPVLYTAFSTVDRARRLAEAWFVATAIAVSVAIVQFVNSVVTIAAAGGDFYPSYVNDRISGFFSHWMTFSQAGLLVFVTLLSYLLFAKRRPGFGLWAAIACLISLGLVLSYTRSVWLALPLVGLYFVAVHRPRTLPAAAVLLAVGFLAAPESIQERVRSINLGANQARVIMWRTGLNMIAAHPLFGVGPEQVGPRFGEFQPADVIDLPEAFYAHLHNVYIHYAAERGVPAALIVLWLFGCVLWHFIRGLRSLPAIRDDRRFLLHAGIAGTLAMMLVSCFDVSLGDSEVLGAYLGLATIAYRGLPERSSRAIG